MSNAAVAPKRAYRIIMVTINTGSTPTVDPEPVHVSKGRGGRGDEIVWECKADPKWEVRFDNGSPFNNNYFHQGNNCSGPVSGSAVLKAYKYSVKAGGGTADPNTIVDP